MVVSRPHTEDLQVTDASITAYRLALDRLQDVSRVLAEHFETCEQNGAHPDGQQVDEIWTQYRQTLRDCQHAFRHVPAVLKAKVPPPPRV